VIYLALCDETISFFTFVLIGIVFSIIFDFFRAIRKLKQVKRMIIYFQDIVYFNIIGTILLIVILNMQKDVIRLYLIIAIVIGILLYISIIGNKIMKLFLFILKTFNNIIDFIFLFIILYYIIFNK